MAIQLGTTRYLTRRNAPVTRLAQPLPRRAAVWPTVSIVILMCLPVLFGPLVMTVLNSGLLLLAVALALLTNYSIDRRLMKIIVPFALMIFFGLAMGVGANRYEWLKDAWYVGNPVLVLLTGYVLYVAKPDLRRGLRAFVLGGLVVGLWQMRGYVLEPELILLSAGAIRRVIGTGFYAPVLSLMILIVFVGRWKTSLGLPGWIGWPLFVIVALSVAGVFSRTALLVVIIGVAALLGCFAKREWLRLGVPLVIAIGVTFSMQLFVDVESDRALQSFGGKLARSVQELMVIDYSDVRDVNLSYRGHETKQAMNQFAASSVPEMLLGRGFGATVDLGFALPLGGSESSREYVRYITFLHNGYAFLLTKVGLLGMLLYIYVLGFLYLVARPSAVLPLSEEKSRVGRLFQATVVTLAATTYVVGGVFNKLDMFPFMLLTGFVLAHLRSSEALSAPSTPHTT